MKTFVAGAALLLTGLSVQTLAPPGASAAPLAASVQTRTATFYPPVDGYRDVGRFLVHTTRQADLTLQVRRTPSDPVLRSVALGPQPAGNHVATWDARDDGGELVDPGNYVVRVVAVGANKTVRSAYDAVRMEWKHLAEQSAVHHRTANSYSIVTGECGVVQQLAGNAVRFDMEEPEACDEGFSGSLDAHYSFADYPKGFTTGKVIHPELDRPRGRQPPGRLRHPRRRVLARWRGPGLAVQV